MSEHSVPPPADFEHAGLGIASLAISIAATALLIALIAAWVTGISTAGDVDGNSLAEIYLALAVIGLFAAGSFALGLGIGDLFQNDRNKFFAILGTIFSLAFVITTGALLVGAVFSG